MISCLLSIILYPASGIYENFCMKISGISILFLFGVIDFLYVQCRGIF